MNKQEKTDYYNYMAGVSYYHPRNKKSNVQTLKNEFLNKTLTMFLYEGLPDSLPNTELEKILQLEGKAWVTKHNDELTAFKIDLITDEVDVYGRALKGSIYLADVKEWKEVDVQDGILIANDFLGIGLRDLFSKYSFLINESSITLHMANVWKRTEKVFTANDDATAESVKNYLKQIEEGNGGVIVSSLLYDSLNIDSPNTQGTSLHDLIEYDNYVKSQFYNEIGLYYSNNMKKERLITSEVETGLNSIYPLVDNMFNSRLMGIKAINDKYDMNIEVEFTSSWEYRLNLGENITELVSEDEFS